MNRQKNLEIDSLTQRVLVLMDQKQMSPKALSLKSGMPLQRLNQYLKGERKLGVKSIKKLALGLDMNLSEVVEPSPDQRLSKFEMIDIFIEAFDQFQRRGSSLTQLDEKEYGHLMNLSESLGGWKKVMTILERELFEVPGREKRFQDELLDIFQQAHASARARKTNKKARCM